MTYFHNFYLVLFPERFVVGCENTASAVAFNTVEGESWLEGCPGKGPPLRSALAFLSLGRR